MSNTDWIKDLKESDKVYVRGGGFDRDSCHLTTIKKITSKGLVRIESGRLFKDGHCRLDSWHTEYLEQWTPELEAKLKAEAHYKQMAYSINAMDMRTVSSEKVQKIYDILNDKSN